MRTLAEANKYLSDQAPWKLRETDPERMRTICHVALQLVDDGKTLLTPFLPRSSQKVYEMLGGSGIWSGMPRIDEVTEDGGPPYPVITGDYQTAARWAFVADHARTPARARRRRCSPSWIRPSSTRNWPGWSADEPSDRAAASRRRLRPGPRHRASRKRRRPTRCPVAAFDSHCHLDMIECAVADTLAQAAAAGISRVVTVGCRRARPRGGPRSARPRSRLYTRRWPSTRTRRRPRPRRPRERDAVLAEIARLAALPQVRAVGETGLDYYRDNAAPEVQRDWFRAHIDIAKQAGKPLMIHDRDAHEDVLSILAADGRAGAGDLPLLLRRRRAGRSGAPRPATC